MPFKITEQLSTFSGRWIFRPVFFRAEMNCQSTNCTKAENYKPEGHECLPWDTFLPVKFYDQFSEYEYNGWIDHCVESESVGLKVFYKASEQFDDDQEGEDVSYNTVKRLAKWLTIQKHPDPVKCSDETDGKYHDNIDNEHIDNIL